MKSEETTIQPGAQFKYLGGIFTIGAMYEDVDTFYFKDQNEEIFEGKISTLKRMVRDGMYHMVKAPGLGVPQGSPQDRSEAEPECGPAGTATPKESAICVEALEKEGWEKMLYGIYYWYKKGSVLVSGQAFEVRISKGGPALKDCIRPRGVSSMQDLRQLEVFVNGK